MYERALAFDEQNPDLYYNLGVVHIERGVPDQALYYFDKALELDPEHVQALMNSAILMQETGRPEFRPTAYDRLFKVTENTVTDKILKFPVVVQLIHRPARIKISFTTNEKSPDSRIPSTSAEKRRRRRGIPHDVPDSDGSRGCENAFF